METLHNLKPKPSCGHDGISTKLLKACRLEICKPLTLIIIQMLTTGILPGALTDEIRSWVNREYALWAPAGAPRNNRPRPATPAPPLPPPSRRQLRRKQYRRVQRLYAKNRSAAADECLSGEWQEPRESAPLDTLEPFWRDLFERQSVRDIRRPVLPLPELGLVRPIKGNRNNKTFLQRLRCILCVITLHSIISYYKMRFYTRKTELEASTCKFPRNLRS